MAKRKTRRSTTARPGTSVDRQILTELKRITAKLEAIHEKLGLGLDVQDSTAHSTLDDINELLKWIESYARKAVGRG